MAVATLPPVNSAFNTTCKLAFMPLFRDEDESPIFNMAALQLGLEAKLREDAGDFGRARELWAEAARLLITEAENEIGASASGSVQMDDSFEMDKLAYGL